MDMYIVICNSVRGIRPSPRFLSIRTERFRLEAHAMVAQDGNAQATLTPRSQLLEHWGGLSLEAVLPSALLVDSSRPARAQAHDLRQPHPLQRVSGGGAAQCTWPC